jgi:CHAD domain-containing protein
MDRGEIRALREPVGPLARERLDRGHRKIRRVGEGVPSGDDAAWHRLRIAVKRQRYVLEAFRGGCPAKRVARYAEALVGLQERLGAIQDLVTAERLLTELASRQGDAERAFLAGMRVGWEREKAEAREEVLARWQRFVEGERPWHERGR